MPGFPKTLCALTALSLLLSGALTRPADAITAELAKKCRAMALDAHPRTLAGSKSGSAAAERAFFQTCVANDGKMPAEPPPSGAPATTPPNPPSNPPPPATPAK